MLHVLPKIPDCFLILPSLLLLLQHLPLKVPEADITNTQTLQSFSQLGIPNHPHTPESCADDSMHPTAAALSSFLTSGLLPRCLAWIKTHLCGLKLALFTGVPQICKCVCFHTLCSLPQGVQKLSQAFKSPSQHTTASIRHGFRTEPQACLHAEGKTFQTLQCYDFHSIILHRSVTHRKPK